MTTSMTHTMLKLHFPFFSRSSQESRVISAIPVASSNASLKSKKTRRLITWESTSRRFSVPARMCLSSWTSVTDNRSDDGDEQEQQSTEVRPYGNLPNDTEACTLKHAYEPSTSESAQIAQQYRLSQSLKEHNQDLEIQHPVAPFSFDHSLLVSSPSCSLLPASPEMAGQPSEHGSSSCCDSDAILGVRAQDAHLLHEMLCSVKPVIIDQPAEQVDDDGALLPYSEDPRNLIITSRFPELAPHIVITVPPEGDVVSATLTDDNTGAGLPYLPRQYLFVPPLFRSTCRMHTYQELLEDNPYLPSFSHPPHSRADDLFWSAQVTPVSRPLDPPLPVFSRSRLNDWVTQYRKDEQQWPSVDLKSILSLVRRKQMIMLFNEAAYKAIEFRERYDDPQFLDCIEASSQRLFMEEWIDPALPYLANLRENSPSTHIFESPDPQNIPHIAIYPAPAEDPGIARGNAPPIQDCGEGQSLILISNPRMIHKYINEPAWNPDYEWFVCRSQCIEYSLKRTYWDQWDEWNIEEDRDYYFGDDYESGGYLSDESSTPDSPGPQTPKMLCRLGNLDFLSNLEEDDLCELQDTTIQCFSYEGVSPSPPSKSKFFIEDEDEDDGPPPFDEWFQQIAERNQLPVYQGAS